MEFLIVMKLKKTLKKILNKIDVQPIPEKTLVLGHTMYLQKKGPQFRELAKYGVWEEDETRYVQNKIVKGEYALDIGANIGYFTLLFASLVGDQGRVFSFEPEPSNFKILQKNISVNNYQNVMAENVAVTNFDGRVDLYLSEKAAGWHRIYSSKLASKNNIPVKAIKLDNYFKDINISEKISFIKIDVEGSEFGVLKGMASLLQECKNLQIILEFSPEAIKDFGTEPIELLDYLEKYGFEFFSDFLTGKHKRMTEKSSILKQYQGKSQNIL